MRANTAIYSNSELRYCLLYITVSQAYNNHSAVGNVLLRGSLNYTCPNDLSIPVTESASAGKMRMLLTCNIRTSAFYLRPKCSVTKLMYDIQGGWARVQIRGPRSLFTIKRRNNTYNVTHFT